MTSSFRFFLFAAALPLLALAACKDNKSQIADTGIVVAISSDLLVPDEINQVRLITTDQQGIELFTRTVAVGEGTGRSLPLREGIYPKHETERPIHIRVLGLQGETEVVSSSATVSFEQGKILSLSLPLYAVCRPVKCRTYEACNANGKCESDLVIGTLPPYVPNQTLDAGTSGPEVEVAVDAPADARPDVASDRQPDMARDSAADVPAIIGTASTTGTGTASASATGAETAKETGTGTGQNSGITTGTVTGTGGSATASSTGTAVVATSTSTGTTTSPGTGGTGTGTGTGTGGASTGAGTGTGTGGATRCAGLAATCGPSRTADCCASLPVPGGAFYRSYDAIDNNDKGYPATVSDFTLDKYEITVGRFRQFVNDGRGTRKNPPAAGDGAHAKIEGSGWDKAWDTMLAADTDTLKANLKCDSDSRTWTDSPGANENKPINCLDWYTAFAFCAWDGGRLPTEAEWNYAASGGDQQRYYPWSDPPDSQVVNDSYATYCGGSCSGPQVVGSKSPIGDGRWKHADLAGNLWEWGLDWYRSYVPSCSDCANLSPGAEHVLRGGSFLHTASDLRSAPRCTWDFTSPRSGSIGARCARSAP